MHPEKSNQQAHSLPTQSKPDADLKALEKSITEAELKLTDKAAPLPDSQVRAVRFNPPLLIDGKNETAVDIAVDKNFSFYFDFDKRIVWVRKRNSAGFEAYSWAPFEQLAGVAYNLQGGPAGTVLKISEPVPKTMANSGPAPRVP